MTMPAGVLEPTPVRSVCPGLPARVIGVLFAPRATYAAVAARPRWFGVLALIVAIGGAGTFAFLSTDVGKTAILDQQVRSLESVGVTMTDAAYERLQARAEYGRYIGPAFQAVAIPIAALLVAGIAFGVFNALLGGDGTFTQVVAVVVHSGIVILASQLFGLPLAYARESMAGATNLAVFAPFLDEASFPARLLGAIDLFVIWWAVSLAIGLGVLYKRRTGPIATTLIVIYVAIGVVIAAVKTVLGA